jgi:hypothetical protein
MRFEWSGLLLGALLFSGCAPSLEEVSRVRSPDGLLDAAIFVRQTDATVPTPTEIYMLPAGALPSGDPIWRADKVAGLKIGWTSAGSLQLQAVEARVFLQRDLIEVAPAGGADKRKVTIVYRVERSL